MNKDRIILYCDRIMVVCLCLTIFFLPFAKAVVESFVLFGLFLWLLKRFLGYRVKGAFWGMFPETGLNKALGILIVINAMSVIFTVDFGLSLRGFLGKELKFIAIYFMLVEAINSKKRLKSILFVIIASAVLITANAAVQYFRGVDFIRGYALFVGLSSSFASRNGFGAWLIVVIPLFSGLLAAGIPKRKSNKVLLLVLIVLLSICLLMTYSRGAWLGFIMGFLLAVFYAIKNINLKVKATSLVVIISLVGIFLILPQPIKTKITSIGRIHFKANETINMRIKSLLKIEEGGSSLIRIKLWKEAIQIIKDYNFIGCGLNTYSIVARNYKSFNEGGVYPHNSYLHKAAEIGLLGLLAFLWVLFRFFKIGFCYLSQNKDFLVLGLLSGIVGFLVHAFFDAHLYSLQLVVLFWYMLGLTMAVINLGTDSNQNPGG